jgi:DNA-binding CsgD family transcriptional regulator
MWLASNGPIGGNLPFRLKAGEFEIGRSNECEIIILDSSISPIHARLRVTPGGQLHIADLGSKNGIFISGQLASAAALSSEQEFQIGAVSLRISAGHPLQDSQDDSVEESPVSLSAQNKAQALVSLTLHQREVLQLVAQGLTEDEVAIALGRSFHTVHNHLKQIYKRFNVHSRQKLIAKLHSDSYHLYQ